ncbi:hypothetical protein V8C35DRAFT_292441 [Trichoderma chlorosporum]
MTQSIEKSAADLVASLNGKDVMCGWHVLVSYHEDDLNKLLATRHAELDKTAKVTKVAQFKQPYTDPIHPKVKVDIYYDLTLGTPLMSFIDGKGSIVLKYPISGTFKYTEAGDATEIPPSLFLKCTTDLKHAQGSLSSGDKTPLQTAEKVVSFENGAATESHIVIDLLNAEASVVDAKDEKDVAFDILAKQNLAEHIREVGLQYNLATLSSSIGANAPKSQLIPSKFVMTSVPATGTEKSSLIMWIGLKGLTCAGWPNTANTPLLFAPEPMKQISPIPKEKGAIVYIARDVVYSLFVKPGLEGEKFTNISLVNSTEGLKDGLIVSATPPSTSVTVPEWAPDGHTDQEGDRVCPSFSFNMDASSATIRLSSAGSTLAYEQTVKDVKFYKIHWTSAGPDAGVYQSNDEGKADFKLTAETSASWKNDGNDEKLSLSIEAPKSFESEATNHDQPNLFQEIFMGHLKGILPGMNDIKITIPEVKIDFGAIDYFLTTNILLPGSHVFKPGKASEDVYIPHELLILGSI